MKENQKGQIFWNIWSWKYYLFIAWWSWQLSLFQEAYLLWFKPPLVPSTKTTLLLALGLTLLVEDRQPKGNKISRVGCGLAEGCCTKVVLATASSLLKAFFLWSTATICVSHSASQSSSLFQMTSPCPLLPFLLSFPSILTGHSSSVYAIVLAVFYPPWMSVPEGRHCWLALLLVGI